MKRLKLISSAISIVVYVAVISAAERASALVLASDNASNPAYAFEADGAWKGSYAGETKPEFIPGQNPEGTDNGGNGFGIWNFSGGSHAPSEPVGSVAPYGRLNHFIDGVDFPSTTYNDLGAPAFGLGNCNPGYHCYGTATATRPFAQPLQVGDRISVDIDTPAEYDNYAGGFDGYPFVGIGFVNASGQDMLGIQAGGDDVDGPGPYPWAYDDLTHSSQTSNFGVDAGVGTMDENVTSDGSTFSLEITSATTGRATLDGVSLDVTFQNEGPPTSIVLWAYDNNAEGTMGNPTGEHAFYFNNLKIERPPFGVPGDYNQNGNVDAADYVVWRKNFGSPTSLPNDDTAGVGPDDHTRWQVNFGRTTGSGAAASGAVPEPTTALMLWFATLSGFARRHVFLRDSQLSSA